MSKQLIKLVCQICGKEYWKRPWQVSKSKYCSLECLTESKRKPRIKKICQQCGVEYEVEQYRKESKYCSRQCVAEAKKKPKTIARCLACGTMLELQPYAVGSRKYCSHGCYVKHHVPWNKGRKVEATSGPNHPNWQGGITSQNTKLRRFLEYKQWRQAVFRRDWFRCVVCNRKPKKIESHHIRKVQGYPELIYDTANGVTLCVSCHAVIRNEEDDYIDMFDRLLEDQKKMRTTGFKDHSGQIMFSMLFA